MTLQALIPIARLWKLYAIVIAVWSPKTVTPRLRDIAWQTVRAVLSDAAPVWSTEHELAVVAQYEKDESHIDPSAFSWLDAPAWGLLQQQREECGRAPVGRQVSCWLRLLHDGAQVCPAHPAAPLSGGCARAWKLADRRAHEAWSKAGLAP